MTLHLFKLLSLGLSFAIFTFGVSILYQNRKAYLNRLFFLCALLVAYRLICEGEMRSAGSLTEARFWADTSFLRPLVLAVFLHFTLYYTGFWNRLNRLAAWCMVYLPALFFSWAFLAVYDKEQMLLSTGSGWVFRNAFPSVITRIHLAWALLIGTISAILFWLYYRKTTGDERRHILVFSSFFTLTQLVLTVLSILKLFQIFNGFYLNGVIIIVAAIFMGYLVRRYRLLPPPSPVMDEILASMDDGLIIIENDGRLSQVNRAIVTMTGLSEKELIGKNVSAILHDDIFLNALTDLKQKTSRHLAPFESVITTGKGDTVPVNCVVSSVRPRKGHPPMTIVICRDLTFFRKIESELHKAHKLETIELLTKGITHDFNNMLTAMSLNFSMVDFDPTLTDIARVCIQTTNQAAQMAGEMLKELGSFFRDSPPDTGAQCTLAQVIRKSADIVACGSEISFDFGNIDRLPAIRGDYRQLMRVFINLFINARQAGDAKVAVALSGAAEPEHDSVILTVSDNGPGMPTEVTDHIFQPFFTTKSGGSGLGLAIVSNIIRSHNGSISVASEVGRGTNFTITLPLFATEIRETHHTVCN